MTDRFNTISGWILGSGIVALGLSIISGMYFHADKPEHLETPGYAIEGAAEEAGADQGPSLATLLAEGDAAAGANVFAKCISCHTVEPGGADGIGPNIHGIVGKPMGAGSAGFAYSSDLAGMGQSWTYENLDQWLNKPKSLIAGTKMSFAGLSKPEDRANVILYMLENGGGPALPTPEAPAEEVVEEAAGDEAEAEAVAEANADQDAAAEIAEATE